jgi:hypothetical protein
VIGSDQPVDERGLMLLDPADIAKRSPQLRVHARRGVLKAQRLHLDAVHENNAYPRECVVIQLANRFLHQLAPCEALLVEGSAGRGEKIQTHDECPLYRVDRVARFSTLNVRA